MKYSYEEKLAAVLSVVNALNNMSPVQYRAHAI